MKKRHALLWEISAGKALGKSYLFGTMHVKDPQAFSRREIVCAKIAACDWFCTEIALDAELTTELVSLQLPPGQTLDRLLPPKRYQKLRKILRKSVQVDLDALRFFKPVVVTQMIDEQMLQKGMPEALDRYLWNYAQSIGKKCGGIETLKEQLDLLNQIPLDLQLKSLLQTGRNISAQRRRVRHMTRVYKRGDIYRISRIVRRSGKMRGPMIYDRNEKMSRRLATLMEDRSVFLAVGAGHLGGGKGIIRFLKQQGFRLRPIA